MFYATIDCGTTNSRAYIVDDAGKVYGKAVKMVGVKDTATSGSSKTLEEGVRFIIAEAAQQAGIRTEDIKLILSSGMITSEIGLVEIPHLTAPCGMSELAKNIVKVDNLNIIGGNIPAYFVRGIKNKAQNNSRTATEVVGELDFMRGEETQVAGILTKADIKVPATIVILSSHTKFIPVNASGKVLGSLTTMSGQLYDAIINHTFVSKSVKDEKNVPQPEKYFDENIVDHALSWIGDVGLVRSLMFPRFLDVLLKTTWYERSLFLQALIAAEDTLAIGQLSMFDEKPSNNYILVGQKDRCRLYGHILSRKMPGIKISNITEAQEIDQLSILGILAIARKAGIIHG